jgi:hypothetical protein
VSCNRTIRVVQPTACLDEKACINHLPGVQLTIAVRTSMIELLEKWVEQPEGYLAAVCVAS